MEEETMKNKKQELGQFYTTNYNYILQNMYLPKDITHMVEPFAGNLDLLKWVKTMQVSKHDIDIECFDIDPKDKSIEVRDTILNPPDYRNKFVLTNPPYLARNKCKDKTAFDKYNTNDLYKCFIEELIKPEQQPIGGILIVPLNFWCSIRDGDISLRHRFLEVNHIVQMNIFEEKVFHDTGYTVCSFQFCRKGEYTIHPFTINIYPSNKVLTDISLHHGNNFAIGGEIYKCPQNSSITIDRLTRKNKETAGDAITNILVKCIDDNAENKIRLEMVSDENRYIDETEKTSARSYATLVIKPAISIEQQLVLVDCFNEFLEEKRSKYNSLFLTNYRESNTIARKRISFSLVYEIVNYLLTSRIL